MNIYEYNSSTANEYLEEDFGFISSSPSCAFDCEEINNFIQENDNYGCIGDSVAFGSIELKSGEETKTEKVSDNKEIVFKLFENLLLINNVTMFWVGFNVIFESNSSLVRKVVPDVSGG